LASSIGEPVSGENVVFPVGRRRARPFGRGVKAKCQSGKAATRDSVLLSNATGIGNLALFSIGVNPMCLLEI